MESYKVGGYSVRGDGLGDPSGDPYGLVDDLWIPRPMRDSRGKISLSDGIDEGGDN
jgi:hypothetical protein